MFHLKSISALGLCAGACMFAQGGPGPAHVGAEAMAYGKESVRVISAEFSIEGKVVKGSPYSAQITTASTQTLADGNRIVNSVNSFVARDSEGRTRREQTIKAVGQWATGQNPPAMIFIHDPVAQVSYVLEPNTRNAHKTSLARGDAPAIEAAIKAKHEAETAARSARPGVVLRSAGPVPGDSPEVAIARKIAVENANREVAVESLGSKVIEGVQADGRRMTRTIPAGQIGNEKDITIVDEIWTSSELNTTVMSRHSDPQMGETVYTLTNIQRAEPDPALFTVPAGYTVVDGPGFSTTFVTQPRR